MAKATAAVEPSMEEILASIRRIISDDGMAPLAMDLSSAGGDILDLDAPIDEADLDLVFDRAADDPASTDTTTVEAVDSWPLTDEPPPAAADPAQQSNAVAADKPNGPVEEPPVAVRSSEIAGRLVRDAGFTRAGAQDAEPPRQAFAGGAEAPAAKRVPRPAEVAGSLPRDDAPPEPDPLVSESTGASVNAAFGQLTHTILANNARTLDDLVKEMLRPMLKGWLDENLPVIVERLVRAEIERVSRGR